LNGQEFLAMDSNRSNEFTFTPGLSLYINCETQEEVDRLWEKLSEGGHKDRCGWLQDKFGVSWQVIPTALPKYMMDKDPAKSQSVMQAMLQMTKIEIAGLEKAYAEQ
jgi:predicted 3-demethylubiquinone-9 3-methyltransferase (glyoxalase superfamily)